MFILNDLYFSTRENNEYCFGAKWGTISGDLIRIVAGEQSRGESVGGMVPVLRAGAGCASHAGSRAARARQAKTPQVRARKHGKILGEVRENGKWVVLWSAGPGGVEAGGG